MTPRGCFALRSERVPGSPAWPMTAEDRAVKFRNCAEPILGRTGTEQLLECIRRCLELPDVRELTVLTVPAYSAKRTKSGTVPA